MNIQAENGYVRIANELYEATLKLHISAYELRVLHCIIRKTYGFNKKTDRIAYSQISELTNIAIPHVCRTVKALLAKNILTKIGKALGINKNFDTWQPTNYGKGGKLPKMVSNEAKENLPASKVTKNGNTEKVTEIGNKKLPKMVNTKDNKDIIDTNVSIGETPQKEKYGKQELTRIIEDFTKVTGHIPADKRPRYVAHNINQLTSSFVKNYAGLFLELRGESLTKEYVFKKFYLYLLQKKYLQDIEKLETVKLKLKVYLADIATRLEAEKKDKSKYINIIPSQEYDYQTTN